MTPTTFPEFTAAMWDLHDSIKGGLAPELAARRLEVLVNALAMVRPDRASRAKARELSWRAATGYERAQVVGHLRRLGSIAGPLSPVREAMERAASSIDASEHVAAVTF
jgi:hypothetical protein